MVCGTLVLLNINVDHLILDTFIQKVSPWGTEKPLITTLNPSVPKRRLIYDLLVDAVVINQDKGRLSTVNTSTKARLNVKNIHGAELLTSGRRRICCWL